MVKKHSQLVNDIKLYLESLPFSLVVVVTPGQYGSMRSKSDIIACLNGKFVAIEAKVGKDEPSQGQDRFLSNVAKAKGVAIVTRSLEMLKFQLKYFDLF